MSHHNSDNYVQELYEGDQSKLYSGLLSHHHGESADSSASKAQVSRILKITLWLSVITIVEVVLGLTGYGLPRWLMAIIFLCLTVVKAGLIVRVFMHLGDEKKSMIVTVLIPLALFIWFIIAFLADGSFWLHMNDNNPAIHTLMNK